MDEHGDLALINLSSVDALYRIMFGAAKLRKLRPSFKDGGTVTAGNASIISDGAAALVLVSGAMALELGLQVIAKIRGFADAAQVLRHKNGKYGVGGICNGGGGASALVLEFMQAVPVIHSLR